MYITLLSLWHLTAAQFVSLSFLYFSISSIDFYIPIDIYTFVICQESDIQERNEEQEQE